MTIAVLVVSYGSHDLVAAGLARTAVPDDGIVVVVDNFTTDAERDRMRLAAEREGWHLLDPDTNLGFGAGMNAAAAHAISLGASSLVLLNPDAYIEADGVAALCALVEVDDLALVSPLVVRPDGRHFASLMEVDLDTGDVRRVRSGTRYPRSRLWVSGACVAASARLWERVGGFDDDYFLYWEDVDLSLRVAQAGGTVRVAPEIRAVHDPGGTQRGDGAEHDRAKSPTYYFYNTRNRLVFATKHLDRATRRRWRRRAVTAAYRILLRGGRRQFLRPHASILPAARGTLAGLRFRPTGSGT